MLPSDHCHNWLPVTTEATRMDTPRPAHYDHEIEAVLLLRGALDDAWASLRPEERAEMSRTFLAEGIRKAAAGGERDPERLRDAALMAVAA
jgi:hypothetical protein